MARCALTERWMRRYPEIAQAIQQTTEIVEKLREDPTLELEARFGYRVQNCFEPGVPRSMIDRVVEMMNTSSYVVADGEWAEEQDFLYTENGKKLRTRVNCSETMTVKAETIIKENIASATFNILDDTSASQALRISLKKEEHVKNVPLCVVTDCVRIKQRRRFTTSDGLWAFDFAIAWSDKTKSLAEQKQAQSDPVFEIECELINPQQALACHTDVRIATSLLLKMHQLLEETNSNKPVLTCYAKH